MFQLIVGRTLFSLATLLFVGLILFALTRAGPGSPARIVLGADATNEQLAVFEHQNGLDRPVLVQYAAWIERVALHGDFGRSFVSSRNVATEIANALPVTLSVVCFAFAIAVTFGLAIGVIAALSPGGI